MTTGSDIQTIRWTRDRAAVDSASFGAAPSCDRCGLGFVVGDAIAFVEPIYEDGTLVDVGSTWHADGCPRSAA